MFIVVFCFNFLSLVLQFLYVCKVLNVVCSTFVELCAVGLFPAVSRNEIEKLGKRW